MIMMVTKMALFSCIIGPFIEHNRPIMYYAIPLYGRSIRLIIFSTASHIKLSKSADDYKALGFVRSFIVHMYIIQSYSPNENQKLKFSINFL